MKINWMGVVRDVFLIYCLIFIGGLVVGFFLGPGPTRIMTLIISSLFLEIVGFTISGCLIKINRFKHLFIVAIGVWIVNLSNIVLGMSTFTFWLISLLTILVMMLIGGGLSFLFVRTPKTVHVPGSPDTPRVIP
jgi:hypothetical protein